MPQNKTKKPPREGFRRRINPWYAGMTKKQVAVDVAKTAGKWVLVTVLAYVYWLVMLLLLSLFLLNIWHVKLVQLMLYAGVACAVTSLLYGGSLIHKKLYY